jgi:ComF family protein
LFVRAAGPTLRNEAWDGIVPVPLHAVKWREREFNQAEKLAAPLSQVTGIPLNTKLLKRVENTRSQTKLTPKERFANMQNAFAMAKDARCREERLVLVDDVFTTGATTNACARVLRKAGAGAIWVWTLARGM